MTRHAAPLYSLAEELAHAISHGFGLVLSLAGLVALVTAASLVGETRDVVACAVFGVTLVALYAASTLYHSLPPGRAKEVFRRLDHAAIFLLIAGTYTPFALVTIGGDWGLGLFLFVWAVGLVGIGLKLFLPHRFERLSIVAYLVMGWTIIFALGPLLSSASLAGLILLAAGGLLYSVGVIFHLWERLRFQNAIWHGFVVAAAACHFAAVITDVALVA